MCALPFGRAREQACTCRVDACHQEAAQGAWRPTPVRAGRRRRRAEAQRGRYAGPAFDSRHVDPHTRMPDAHCRRGTATPRSLPATSSQSPLAVGHSARRRRASTSVCAGKRRASAERPPSAAGMSGKSEKPMTSRGRLVRRSVYMELCTRRRAGSRPSRSSASTSAPGGERGEVSEAAGARVRLRGAARARRRGSRPKGLDVLLLHRCRAQGSARQVLGSMSRTVYTAGVGPPAGPAHLRSEHGADKRAAGRL